MYQRKRENVIRCPLEYGMELFGGKWNSHIICVLAVLGTLRYSEPRREMGNITGLCRTSSPTKRGCCWRGATPCSWATPPGISG